MTRRAPYRAGDPVRVLVLDPETGGTVLAPATVEHCDPTTFSRWPWRVVYRLNTVQSGAAICDDTGEGDAILPAAQRRAFDDALRVPVEQQPHQPGRHIGRCQDPPEQGIEL